MIRFFRRLIALFRHGRDETEAAREMSSHLALLEDDYLRRGMAAEEARLAARRAMGSVALAGDLHRDARSFGWVEDLARDVAAGLTGSAAVTRYLEGMLFGVRPLDPVTFAGAAAVFAVVALAAAIVPARRALRISPSLALRAEC